MRHHPTSRATAATCAVCRAVGIALAMSLVAGSGCVTTGRDVPLTIIGPPAKEAGRPHAPDGPARMTLLTFNIYNYPWNRAERLGRINATILEDAADVVALQEVGGGWMSGDDARPSLQEVVKKRYPFAIYFMEERWGPLVEDGLMLLSRWPIRNPRGRIFTDNTAFNRKGFLTAQIQGPWGPLNVVVVHVDSTNDEVLQSSEIEELLRALADLDPDEPLMLLGDLNMDPAAPPLVRLLQQTGLRHTGAADSLTEYKSWSPSYEKPCDSPGSRRLDYVLVNAALLQLFKVKEADGGVYQPHAPFPSDHCPVWARLGPAP